MLAFTCRLSSHTARTISILFTEIRGKTDKSLLERPWVFSGYFKLEDDLERKLGERNQRIPSIKEMSGLNFVIEEQVQYLSVCTVSSGTE